MQYNDKGVLCVSWKGIRLENHLLERLCAFGEVLAGCALKFAVFIMTVSKGVVNRYVG